MEHQAKIVVIGCGSAGVRHARNFSQLGCTVSGVDPRADRREAFVDSFPDADVYESIDAVLNQSTDYLGAIIASPPKFHINQARNFLLNGTCVLLEKPPGICLTETLELNKELSSGRFSDKAKLLLGYTWRWWPALQGLKKKVQAGFIGQPYYCRIHVSAHLADWHPWEDYRNFFMSQASLGGGALLDESHWIDQALWLFGPPTDIRGTIRTSGTLDIDTDDNTNILLSYPDGLEVSLHLDLLGRPHEKHILVLGSNGRLDWNEKDNCVNYTNPSGASTRSPFDNERNDMFSSMAQHFLDCCLSEASTECTLTDGVAVMKVVEAVRDKRNA